MIKNKKIIVALSLIGTFAYGNAFAATAVVLPSQMAQIVAGLTGIQGAVTGGFATYFNPVSGVYTRAAAQMAQQQTNALDGIQQTQQIQISQQEQTTEKQDYRNRTALGMAKIAELDNAQRPTVQQCVEASRSAYRGGAASASFGGGWSRGSKNKGSNGAGGDDLSILAKQDRIVSSSASLAAPLNDMLKSKTCSSKFGGVASCPVTDANAEFAEVDIQSQSLKNNASSNGRADDKNFVNWTLNDDAYKVSLAYIANSILSRAPKSFKDQKDFQKNPIYTGYYRQVMSRLNSAQEALLDIVDFRKESKLSDFATAKWKQGESDYKAVFPDLKFPAKPSLFEVVNFDVYNDYFGPKSEKLLTGDELTQDVARKAALANFLALKQLTATENNNILLANLLAQTTTPIDMKQVDAEFNKSNQTVSGTTK